MKVYKYFLHIFIAIFYYMSLSLWSADWTPIKFTVIDKRDYCGYGHCYDICDIKKTKTIGIDLGLWLTGTCMVIGTQIAPLARSDKMYGIRFGLLAAQIRNEGYGLQLAGLISDMQHTKGKNYVVQISGLANNPVFWYGEMGTVLIFKNLTPIFYIMY